jgi:hypothetical protein
MVYTFSRTGSDNYSNRFPHGNRSNLRRFHVIVFFPSENVCGRVGGHAQRLDTQSNLDVATLWLQHPILSGSNYISIKHMLFCLS